MPVVFKNPNLPDYFLDLQQVQAETALQDIPSVVQPFENGRVITLPNLRFDLDLDYWSGLDTDPYPRLKKLTSCPPAGEGPDALLDERLKGVGAPPAFLDELRRQIRGLYRQVLPVYERLFAGYAFTRRHAVWRLNTIMNENMHVDTYPQPFADHFARMFINLDTQPRIWKTSWPIKDMYARFSDRAQDDAAEPLSADGFRTRLNAATFGPGSKSWFDNEPRHVIYFQPGECWIVDSRQVAHQIFYGRRAVSIDFFVHVKSMRNPQRHYLHMAERLRRQALASKAATAG